MPWCATEVRRVVPLVAVVLVLGACGSRQTELGEPFDESVALPLRDLVSAPDDQLEGRVAVSGTVAQVCRSAGCWFVLRDVSDDGVHDLYVDLKPAASFTVGQELVGRSAVVVGKLNGRAPDWELHASGLVAR